MIVTAQEIRWIQRFENFGRALVSFRSAISLANQPELSDLEKQGLFRHSSTATS